LLFAIVDIETTGSFPQQNGITEIAIVLHNGNEVEGKYETLVNPHQPIPPYIVGMTGITNAMAAAAPNFEEVAPHIFQLLHNRVFVAHNVNFDYSFVKHHLQAAGFDLTTPKLCTIRLSRKVFPGYKKYGLGHLSRELGIKIENRHRAGGDATATAEILDLVLKNNGERVIKEMLQKDNKEYFLPPNLPKYYIDQLPQTPGVYYFHNKAGKVVYVGKAKNIKKRVLSHFTGFDISKKRQDFLREIYAVTQVHCNTEFIASVFESIEIKRLWPAFNKSQKRYEQLWGIYMFEDARGYKRLAIDKKHKYAQPIIAFSMLVDAHRELWKWVRQFELNASLCFLDKNEPIDLPTTADYNKRIDSVLSYIGAEKESFIIREKQTHIVVEKGKFIGMGDIDNPIDDFDTIKANITNYPENEVLKTMLKRFAERYPERLIFPNIST
jgi:DNA polymerase III subunit epsilon